MSSQRKSIQPKVSAGVSVTRSAGRSRGRPRQEDVSVIEKKLLSIALEEFLQHGYGGASMSRIVKAAGASKTTLYSRFSSKEALFRAIMDRQVEHLAPSTLLGTEAGKFDLETGLKTYANRMLERSLRGELLGVNRLLYSESHRFPELGAAAADRTALGILRIAAFIRECAVADGVPCKDPEAVAEVFIYMIRGWYVDIMVSNRKVRPSRREQWVNRVVHALLSPRSQW